MTSTASSPRADEAASGSRGPLRARDARLAAGVALGVIATRIPFLSAGFGADPDAWRIVHAAQNIATHHTYFVSRLPGFPIPELAYALLPANPALLNGLTALFSALAAGALAILARRLGARAPALAGLMLATTPIVWLNSSVTMDYVWSLAFAIGGLLALVDGRVILAGVGIGLAAGCRITAILFLVPALTFLIATRRPSRDAMRVVFSAGAVALAAFSPVLLRFADAFMRSGASFFGTPMRRVAAEDVAAMATVGVWGGIGFATLIGACVWIAVDLIWRRRVRGGERPADRGRERRAALLLCASGLLVFLLAYLRLPYAPGYLIPIVPFVVIALGLLLGRRAMACVAALIALSGFVAVSGCGVSRGMLLEDLRVRRRVTSGAEAILAEGDRLTTPTVVVSRRWLPAISVLLFERGCRSATEAEAGERRRITCGSTTWVKTLTPLDPPAADVLHVVPGGGRRTLGPGFPYPERP